MASRRVRRTAVAQFRRLVARRRSSTRASKCTCEHDAVLEWVTCTHYFPPCVHPWARFPLLFLRTRVTCLVKSHGLLFDTFDIRCWSSSPALFRRTTRV